MAEESDLPLQAVGKKCKEDLNDHGGEKQQETEEQEPDNKMLTMVSHFYDSVKSLTDFHSQYPKLTTLYITGIPLDSLNGVQHLPNLTHLFAMKCKLKNVRAVEECYHLEKLCLYSNAIHEIPDLKYVQKLQTLWLSGNEISCIKNLESQKNLCELYLNNNKIKEIGSTLQENKNLHTLNLAANPIFSLKEIISLAELHSLSSLILTDSQHDMQPMTELLNYSSYIIYHLNKLEVLDGYPIDQKERNRVTVTFDYPVMTTRIHMNRPIITQTGPFSRTSGMLFYSNLMLQFRIMKYKLLGDYYKDIWIKREENREALAKFRKWFQIYTSLAVQLDRGALKSNLQQNDIKARFEYLSMEVRNWDAEVAEYMAFLSTMKKIRLTQLDYELENANNLKFIAYEADNEIVDIFNTIMNSYCCSHIERQYDIVGVQVVRVTQIINNSFKAMIKSCNSEDLSSDAIMLAHPTPVAALSDWPFNILEKGFMANKSMTVSVTDCLDFADASWMNTLQNLRQRNISLSDQIQNSIRVTVIVKLPEEKPFLRNREQLYTSEEDEGPKSSDSCEATGLHVPESTDSKKCQVYHITNSSEVIPTYVVEYKYKYKEDKLKLLQQNIGLDVHSCYVSIQEPYTESCKLSLETMESYLPRPIIINFLREMRLVGCNIRTLDENLPHFPSLISLNLSCNQIRELPRMDIFPRLKNLELSYNNITDIKQMTVAPSLESLNISWNRIAEILPVFTTLKSCAHNLMTLSIAHNPIEDVIRQNHILFFAAKYLQRLQTLDDNSPHVFIKSFHNIKIEGTKVDNILKQKSNKIVAISLKWKAEICNNIHKEQNVDLSTQNNNCWISMNDQNLAQVILMQVNPELQWIDLSDNYIDDISFLRFCPNAKEISLENNVLTALGSTIRSLKNLTYLNISQNYLTSLEDISHGNFPCLQLLDVSSNNLSDLNGVEYCTALQECYFSSNMIAEYDGLTSLKDCRMLRIIDMTGNPVDSKKHALSYIIYRNQNIEIVNGYQIQPSDVAEASQVFCGILDKNYLWKEMYTTDLSKLTEVTLTYCAIKKIELPGDVLPSVLSIDLSNNNLQYLSGLHELPQLQTLCLSGNKISEMGLMEDSSIPEIYPELKTLYLDNNGIFSITPLELGRLKKLTRLYLQCNMIDSVQGLEGLSSLIALVLDWNRITSVTREQVSSFSGLNELHLERNKITHLSFLKQLKQLQRLYLSYNKIHDFDQLKYVAALNHLEELTLIANPICPHHTSYHDLTAILPRFYIYIHSCDSEELPL